MSLGVAYAIFTMAGCTPSSDLGGVEIINAVPDTYVTGSPPYLRATDFFVQFYWSGNDPDGRIDGFEWKISTNGDDGISVIDTLTVDPATGDTINPWHYTTATDSIFFVSADSSNFIDDFDLPDDLQRFYQPHTLFVRAVDDDGAPDPSPAMLTFTATTFAPTVYLSAPPSLSGVASESRPVPPTFLVKWTGNDPDFELGEPTRIRYMIKDALYTNTFGDEVYLTTRHEYNRVGDTLITFSDPSWSDWISYASDPDARSQSFTREKYDSEDRQKHYLFAIQAQDTAGAVSLDRSYGNTVKNFYINDIASPTLVIRERYLGAVTSSGLYGRTAEDIAQNQPLRFEWSGSAASYGGVVTGYRYGWDIEDLTYDDDPGWVTQFGLTDAHTRSEEIAFDSGSHVLIVECIDNSDLKTRYTYVLNVVPVPDSADQLPLILIDDVQDLVSNGWPDVSGSTAFDNDIYRDAFWVEVLQDGNSVSGFNAARDMLDNEERLGEWGYREVVPYKNILWTSRWNNRSYLASNFQGRYIDQGEGEDPLAIEAYVWLETYQSNVGNVFLCGTGVMNNFHITDYNGMQWLHPIIYTSDESPVSCAAGQRARSFGTREEDDGSLTVLGVLQYPYRGMGITVSTIMQPLAFYMSPSQCATGPYHAKLRCVGTKGIILDPDFKDTHIGGNAFADTVYIWDTIGWADNQGGIPELDMAYVFGQYDEFYDVNTTPRPTSWYPQVVSDGSLALEPMWHAYTRYDYILDQHLSHGDTDYPDFDPADVCGTRAINDLNGRSLNDGVPLGVFSYQAVEDKPSGTADVIWGFDPHMLDHEAMEDAILWVLGDHFGLTVTP
jgi:hypothetical protein